MLCNIFPLAVSVIADFYKAESFRKLTNGKAKYAYW